MFLLLKHTTFSNSKGVFSEIKKEIININDIIPEIRIPKL